MTERLLSPGLQNKLDKLPGSSGVYLMKNAEGTVIYVGKAVSLKNRVRQYFRSNAGHQAKVAAMVSNVADFEYVMTDSEMEALILECNLIKQYQPYYNILLRDDKHYPYIRIDLSAPYPRIEIVRKVKKDGAKYFGPYLAAHSVRDALDTIYRLFPLRSCKREIGNKKERPCLNFQMGRCLGPCSGNVSREAYMEVVQNVIDVLSGQVRPIVKKLKAEMNEAAEKLDFERAAKLRDRIRMVTALAERQKAGMPRLEDKDVFAAAIDAKEGVIVMGFFVREGKLSRTERFSLTDAEDVSAAVGSFLKQYYMDNTPPPRVFVNALPDEELLEEWLSSLRGSKVTVSCPAKGDNRRLIEMAERNAKEELAIRRRKKEREQARTVGAAEGLGEILGIGYVRRMECYDISNTQGTDSVASMVVFIDGKPAKKEYRRFRIKTVEGADDFASMEEVLTRRLLEGFKAQDQTTGFGSMPDLIIIDGGKGQLGRAVSVLESFGVDIPVVGLAKRDEEIFLPRESEPIVIKKNSPVLGMVTALRDEAHRFAITYHRGLRQKRIISSALDTISGVGEKRKAALLSRFGSIENISRASIDELADVVDIATARAVYQYFNSSEEEEK